jgi:hypothetical protein
LHVFDDDNRPRTIGGNRDDYLGGLHELYLDAPVTSNDLVLYMFFITIDQLEGTNSDLQTLRTLLLAPVEGHEGVYSRVGVLVLERDASIKVRYKPTSINGNIESLLETVFVDESTPHDGRTSSEEGPERKHSQIESREIPSVGDFPDAIAQVQRLQADEAELLRQWTPERTLMPASMESSNNGEETRRSETDQTLVERLYCYDADYSYMSAYRLRPQRIKIR